MTAAPVIRFRCTKAKDTPATVAELCLRKRLYHEIGQLKVELDWLKQP